MGMNLSLSKLPWYAQVGGFVVLSLAGVGAFWNFYYVSARASIDGRKQELAKIQAEADKGLATARRLPQFREDVAKLAGDLERLRAVLPEEKDVADLLRRIQGMATQSNLTIRAFKPQAVATKKMHAEWPIGLELEGTYHDLGGFLERVSKFPRIINVDGIALKPNEASGSRSTVTAKCTATTFVLVDQANLAAIGVTAKKPKKPSKAN
jgi:type IV pilus assembly protein PilO